MVNSMDPCGILLPFGDEDDAMLALAIAGHNPNNNTEVVVGKKQELELLHTKKIDSNHNGALNQIGSDGKTDDDASARQSSAEDDDRFGYTNDAEYDDDDDDDEVTFDNMNGRTGSKNNTIVLDAIHENSNETKSDDDDDENVNGTDNSNNNDFNSYGSSPRNTNNGTGGLGDGHDIDTENNNNHVHTTAHVFQASTSATSPKRSNSSNEKQPQQKLQPPVVENDSSLCFEEEKKEDYDDSSKSQLTTKRSFFDSILSSLDPTHGIPEFNEPSTPATPIVVAPVVVAPVAPVSPSGNSVSSTSSRKQKKSKAIVTAREALSNALPKSPPTSISTTCGGDYNESSVVVKQHQQNVDGIVTQELKTLDYLEERNFDMKPTELYMSLMKKDWSAALLRIIEHPEEACTWIHRKEMDSVSLRWRLLPIHAAIIFMAPEKIIDALLLAFPDCIVARDDQGMMPLHLAIRIGCSESTIMKLLKAYPEAIEKRDIKGRTPRNLVENSRGSQREMFLELLENAPKTQQQIRDEIIREQQELFEQVLKVVQKEHGNEIERINRENVASANRLNAKIDSVATQLSKLQEKHKSALAKIEDVEARLKGKIDSELSALKQLQEIQNAVQIEKDNSAKVKEGLEALMTSSIEAEQKKTAEIQAELEKVRNEKIDADKLLDVAVANYEHAVKELRDRETLDLAVVTKLEAEKEDLTKQVQTLERLLHERTESEQALAWQVSALAEKLGAFGPPSPSKGVGEEASYFGTGGGADEMMMMMGFGGDDIDDMTSMESSDNVKKMLMDERKPAATASLASSSSSPTSKHLKSAQQNQLEATMEASCNDDETQNSEQIRALEREKEELKETVNKLSIKLYKVVGFLDEMVHEQEAIVTEAMKRSGTNNDETPMSYSDLVTDGSNDTRSNFADTYDVRAASSEHGYEIEIGTDYEQEKSSSMFSAAARVTSAAAEQILDSVSDSDRVKFVNNVAGMKNQIIGVIDSVIDSIPRTAVDLKAITSPNAEDLQLISLDAGATPSASSAAVAAASVAADDNDDVTGDFDNKYDDRSLLQQILDGKSIQSMEDEVPELF